MFFRSTKFDFTISGSSFSYSVRIASLLSRLVLDSSLGQIQMLIWINKKWILFSYYPSDRCNVYACCGAYGYYDVSKTLMCSCLLGFKPRSLSSWRLRDSSNSCVRQNALVRTGNKSTDRFRRFTGMKLPEAKFAKTYSGLSDNQCQDICLSNCSCRAYTASRIGCNI